MSAPSRRRPPGPVIAAAILALAVAAVLGVFLWAVLSLASVFETAVEVPAVLLMAVGIAALLVGAVLVLIGRTPLVLISTAGVTAALLLYLLLTQLSGTGSGRPAAFVGLLVAGSALVIVLLLRPVSRSFFAERAGRRRPIDRTY